MQVSEITLGRYAVYVDYFFIVAYFLDERYRILLVNV